MQQSSFSAVKHVCRRSIIAEDPDWHLILVQSLSEICLLSIVNNFEKNPIFEELSADYKNMLMEKLPISLPLSATIEWIPDGVYWQRWCEQQWKPYEVLNHGNSWKRMCTERYVQNIVESFIPDVTRPKALLDAVSLCKQHIKKLDISQLLLRAKEYHVKEVVEKDDDDEEYDDTHSIATSEMEFDYDFEEEPIMDHFDFTILLDKLTNLEELHLSYRIKNCGMNFEWNLFEMTDQDCKSLGLALKSCTTLKVFKLHQSLVDDKICRALVKNLLDHPNLMELDFSNNLISDKGARGLSKLVKNSKLEVLNLSHNRICNAGAKILAHALRSNPPLSVLNLRFNCVMDVGGQAICNALLSNENLSYLHLGGNELTTLTAFALAKLLEQNKSLTRLNLSFNKLGEDGGKALAKALSQNSTLTECDVRQTCIDKTAMSAIDKVVLGNQKPEPTIKKPTKIRPEIY